MTEWTFSDTAEWAVAAMLVLVVVLIAVTLA